MQDSRSKSIFWHHRKSACLLATFLGTFALHSCGEKKEVIQILEEEDSTSTPASTGNGRQNKGTPQGGSQANGEGGQADPTQGQDPAVAENANNPDSPEGPGGDQTTGQPVTAWEPVAVSSLVNKYCAGPCHGVHGKFSSKEYFLSLKSRSIDQLKAGKMPPPNFFTDFRGSTDEATLKEWLQAQK